MTAAPPKTWRDGLIVHPLADQYPMMLDSELKELAADIEKRGLSESVVFANVDGKRVLVDGRNRYAACHMVGRTPTSREVDYSGAALEAFIVSANIHRRHLTPDERVAMLRAAIKAAPEKSDREIARETKVHHSTVAEHRKKLETTGGIPPVQKRKGKDSKTRKLPAKKPAKKPTPPKTEIKKYRDGVEKPGNRPRRHGRGSQRCRLRRRQRILRHRLHHRDCRGKRRDAQGCIREGRSTRQFSSA
jgi:hypothetical protein